MANYRFYTRRIRRIVLSPAFQVLAICGLLFFGIRWVIKHNHDGEQPPALPARPVKSIDDESIDWSKLYYVQYVTSPEYLCNALMIWSQLEEKGSRAQRLMLYPSSWDPNEIDPIDPAQGLTHIARLLQDAQLKYFVKLEPVAVLHQNHSAQATWADSYTKLLAFNLTQFDRVLALDSDSSLQQNLDDLFTFPPAPLAMPLVYWGEPEGWQYSSQLMLITPSAARFKSIEAAIHSTGPDEYDMDILNTLYKGNILALPQRPFNLLSGEFRRRSHTAYLGSRNKKWDPEHVINEAKFIHFSDWPIPKPWIRAKKDMLNKYMPKCVKSEWFGATDCRDRTIWMKLYFDFAVRRQAVCGAGFELQSQELPADSIFRDGRWFHPDDVS